MDSSTLSKRRSFLGSLKKLTRKSSNISSKSDGSKDDINNPFSSPRDPHPCEPPSYTEAVQATRPPARPSSDLTEDEYAFLTKFDTVFLIDDSSSMTLESRWTETREALKIVAPICTKRDDDGIDVYFLNNKNPSHPQGGYTNITSADTVNKLFNKVSPRGPTFTGMRIEEILKPYLKKIATHKDDLRAAGIKPLNLIVITDGFPLDPLEETLLEVAKALDEAKAPSYQLGVQLFQVGSDDEATEYLKQLDDNLKTLCDSKNPGSVRDIVDTVTWDNASGKRFLGSKKTLSGKAILKVVLGGVVKRLDKLDNNGLGSW